MKNLTKKSIPFFGYYSIWFLVYIIDNKVFGYYKHSRGFRIWSNRAIHLLTKIIFNENAKKVFPEKILTLLEKKSSKRENIKEKMFGREETNNMYLFCDHCLDFDIHFDFNVEKAVIIENITFEKFSLDKSISLTQEEAIILLGNLCSAQIAYELGHKLVNIDDEEQIEVEIKQLHANDTLFKNTCNFEFSIYYFKYIQHLLNEEKIKPLQILNYSGLDILLPLVEHPKVFAFLEQVMNWLLHPEDIHKSQLIIYFIFLERAYENLKSMSMKDDSKITVLLEYFLKNKKYLMELKNNLIQPKPESQMDIWRIFSS